MIKQIAFYLVFAISNGIVGVYPFLFAAGALPSLTSFWEVLNSPVGWVLLFGGWLIPIVMVAFSLAAIAAPSFVLFAIVFTIQKIHPRLLSGVRLFSAGATALLFMALTIYGFQFGVSFLSMETLKYFGYKTAVLPISVYVVAAISGALTAYLFHRALVHRPSPSSTNG